MIFMSKEEIKEVDNPLLENAELELETKKQTAEIQRYILDTSELNTAFYSAFSGWRKIIIEHKRTTAGITETEFETKYTIDKKVRIMNESGSNFIANSIFGLVSHITSTSKLSEKQIILAWDGKLRSIEFKLLDNYYFEGNTFEIKSQTDIPEIITTLATLSTITFKAIEGFTLEQITNTIISTLTRKEQQNESENENKGFFGKTAEAIKKIIP